MLFDFQENNQIITLGMTKYRFKDSYTIKIHDCKAIKLDEETGEYVFGTNNRDEALDAFCREILITIGIIDGELDPHLSNCQVSCRKNRPVSIENINLSGTTKLSAFNPLRDSRSFARLKGHSLILSLNLSTFSVNNNKLIVNFNIEKITIIGDLPKPRQDRAKPIAIDELISKNYVHPVDPSCIRTKLLEIYADDTSISSNIS